MVILFHTAILFGNGSKNLTKGWEEKAVLIFKHAYQDVSFLHLYLRKVSLRSFME